MASSMPIRNVLEKSTVQPVNSVAQLETALRERGFASELKSWASLTGAGAAHYAVGVVNNPFDTTTQGMYRA